MNNFLEIITEIIDFAIININDSKFQNIASDRVGE